MPSCYRATLALTRCCCVTVPIFVWDGVRLLLYTIVLAPAFVRFAWYYFFVADRVVVKYGNDSVRQSMDIYWPTHVPHSARAEPAEYDASAAGSYVSPTVSETAEASTAVESAKSFDPWFGSHPVVFFCCGGAWMIGFKMWGALLARVLTAAGVIVVMPDYRNYPWGDIPNQVDDVEAALQWTLQRCSCPTSTVPSSSSSSSPNHFDLMRDNNSYPSLPKGQKRGYNVVIVGQSAGGHLLLTLILRKAIASMKRSQQPEPNEHETMGPAASMPFPTTTSPTNTGSADDNCLNVAGIIALSAPLDINAIGRTFRKHGLADNLVDRLFGGARDDYDPMALLHVAIQTPSSCGATAGIDNGSDNDKKGRNSTTFTLANYLPPIKIYHGSRDATVPPEGSVAFSDALRAAQCDATFAMYDGWSHTDPILEGPMDADHRFHKDILDAVKEWCTSSQYPVLASLDDSLTNNHNETISDTTVMLGGDDTDLLWNSPAIPSKVMQRLCPHLLVQAGRCFMPF